MAILLKEPMADACMAALEDDELAISAGTVAEALILAARGNVGAEMERLIDGLGFEVVNITSASARRVAQTYESWGKGIHPAGLHFGDCFAYELAKSYKCPLLFIGDDFALTDIERAA